MPTNEVVTALDFLTTHPSLNSLHRLFVSQVTQSPDCTASMVKLRQILDDISRAMRQPTISGLEAISQSTMDTLRERRGQGGDQQQQQQPGSRPNSASRGFSFPSWTLPKKKDSAKNSAAPDLSQGTPQHTFVSVASRFKTEGIKPPMF